MSWWNKVFFMLDELVGVLTAGFWNTILGTKNQKYHFGMVNITISAITGVNEDLNLRTRLFSWLLGVIFRNPNHAKEAAIREHLIQ